MSPHSNALSAQLLSYSSVDSVIDSWTKGPYSQKIWGILPPILTNHIILTRMSAIFKKTAETYKKRNVPTNIVLCRERPSVLYGRLHSQKHVMFYVKDGVIVYYNIKCPYTHHLSTADCVSSFLLSYPMLTLKEDHKHYYQVQRQMVAIE